MDDCLELTARSNDPGAIGKTLSDRIMEYVEESGADELVSMHRQYTSLLIRDKVRATEKYSLDGIGKYDRLGAEEVNTFL